MEVDGTPLFVEENGLSKGHVPFLCELQGVHALLGCSRGDC